MSAYSRNISLLLVTVVAAGTIGCSTATAPEPEKRAPESKVEPTQRSPVAGRLDEVHSWAFAISEGALTGDREDVVDRLGRFDLVVVDGEEATAVQIAAVQEKGTIVLGYLSVGTIEPWRSWYDGVKPFRLEMWGDWDEYYADVSDPAYRRIITGTIMPSLMDKGFDGLFLDNIDMPATHPDMADDMYGLVDEMSRAMRSRGAVLFTQNGDDVFDTSFWKLIQGWNREDVTWTFDGEHETYVKVSYEERAARLRFLEQLRSSGMLTMTTDYTEKAGGPEEAECLETARTVGALPYVSDVNLNRIPASPFSDR